MNGIEDYLISSNKSLMDGINKLKDNKHKGLVVLEENRVVGVFTRQDLVKNSYKLGIQQHSLKECCNKNYEFVLEGSDLTALKNSTHSLIPIINKEKELIDIYFPEKKSAVRKYSYPLVVMAGGLGTRLYPYTKVLPKPLVPVNDTPMVELIMNRFHSFGTSEFTLVVNHKKEMIKAYFDELDKDYTVNYAEEEKLLGTGGGLYYAKHMIHDTFFLSNCDILVNENLNEIYEFHKHSNNIATVVVSVKSLNIPYGVIDINEQQVINKFQEKPTYGLLVNTGVYVVEPAVLDFLNEDEKIDFPSLLQRIQAKGEQVGVYPITEDKWIDMGQVNEYKMACDKLKNI